MAWPFPSLYFLLGFPAISFPLSFHANGSRAAQLPRLDMLETVPLLAARFSSSAWCLATSSVPLLASGSTLGSSAASALNPPLSQVSGCPVDPPSTALSATASLPSHPRGRCRCRWKGGGRGAAQRAEGQGESWALQGSSSACSRTQRAGNGCGQGNAFYKRALLGLPGRQQRCPRKGR